KQILQRGEHQRQWRAELVADVAEEGRLGAIDLGERLGPPSLLLIGARAGDGGRNLAGDQLIEAFIVVVEGATRAHSRDQDPGEPMRDSGANRRDNGAGGGIGPGARWQSGEVGGQIMHNLYPLALYNVSQRPGSFLQFPSAEINYRWAKQRVLFD